MALGGKLRAKKSLRVSWLLVVQKSLFFYRINSLNFIDRGRRVMSRTFDIEKIIFHVHIVFERIYRRYISTICRIKGTGVDRFGTVDRIYVNVTSTE